MQLLRVNNVRFQHSDGNWGWPDEGPFDAILSCAAPETIPMELVSQLKIGGRLLMPVGADGKQMLHLLIREEEGVTKKIIEPVNFVPMLSGIQK